MRAVRSHDHAARVADVAEPSGEGVLVHVASAGICGSDLHLLDAFPLAATLGHEFAGTLADGTPVAVEPLDPCWSCGPCRDGDYNRCVRGAAIVLGIGRDGGMAERCLVPAGAVVRLPAGLPVADACLVEPVAVAVHGVRRAGIRAADRVTVVGGGSIGLCAVVAARAVGATVTLVARHPHQREAGERLGARPAGADDPPADVVIEAAGTGAALAECVDRCRPGGRVGLLGSYWEGAVPMPLMAACMKEVDLVPAAMYSRSGPSRDVDVAAAILAADPGIAQALVTHRFPLDAAADAFAVARDRAAGAIKVVLEP
jgi:threonine dehydrogenase-like Zn-dependent dehydrogenase